MTVRLWRLTSQSRLLLAFFSLALPLEWCLRHLQQHLALQLPQPELSPMLHRAGLVRPLLQVQRVRRRQPPVRQHQKQSQQVLQLVPHQILVQLLPPLRQLQQGHLVEVHQTEERLVRLLLQDAQAAPLLQSSNQREVLRPSLSRWLPRQEVWPIELSSPHHKTHWPLAHLHDKQHQLSSEGAHAP